MASWSEDLPLDLLGVVIGWLPNPADRARFRAVCRPWRAAMLHHHRPHQLPWVALTEGDIVTPSDGRSHSLPSLPDNAVTVEGSTDTCLLLGLGRRRLFCGGTLYDLHGYALQDPFSGATVPLTTLDGAIRNHHQTCTGICKFVMRSTADDFIAVVTNNVNYPMAVFRQGKGAWLPAPQTRPYMYIIDVAFLGDTLYAINKAEDLIPLDLAVGGDGKPMVAMGRRVVRQPPDYYDYDMWSSSDDDDDDDENDHQEEEGEIYDSDDDNEGEGQIYHDDDDNGEGEEEEINDKDGIDDDSSDDANKVEEEYNDALRVDDGTFSCNYSTECTKIKETSETNILSRHLIESRGKLLMVRRHRRVKPPGYIGGHTHHVEVLEADASTGAWVPVPVGNGRALFISMNFSKFVPAPCGEVKEDVIYDIDTGEIYDMKSQSTLRFYTPRGAVTWLFPPELVV